VFLSLMPIIYVHVSKAITRTRTVFVLVALGTNIAVPVTFREESWSVIAVLVLITEKRSAILATASLVIKKTP
jgi:hypothetical protein